jgi:hypothetical protein
MEKRDNFGVPILRAVERGSNPLIFSGASGPGGPLGGPKESNKRKERKKKKGKGKKEEKFYPIRLQGVPKKALKDPTEP